VGFTNTNGSWNEKLWEFIVPSQPLSLLHSDEIKVLWREWIEALVDQKDVHSRRQMEAQLESRAASVFRSVQDLEARKEHGRRLIKAIQEIFRIIVSLHDLYKTCQKWDTEHALANDDSSCPGVFAGHQTEKDYLNHLDVEWYIKRLRLSFGSTPQQKWFYKLDLGIDVPYGYDPISSYNTPVALSVQNSILNTFKL
jgi:hypothetical protein